MKKIVAMFAAAAALVSLLLLPAEASVERRGKSPFSFSPEGGAVELSQGSPFEFEMTIGVPEGHYLYADEVEVDFVSLEGLMVSDVSLPESVEFADPFIGKRVEVLRGDVRIIISGFVPEGLSPGLHELVARVSFRGCSPTICYRAEDREVLFDVRVLPPAGIDDTEAPDFKAEAEFPPSVSAGEGAGQGLLALLDVKDFGNLIERGLTLTLAIVFVAGILTSLTPCVWPVIPLVLLFVGIRPQRRFHQNLMTAVTLVAGLILVYALLGVAAAFLGKSLGFLYQQRWFLALVVLFFLSMSLAMLGVFDVRMPKRLQARLERMGGRGYKGAFLAGMGTGLIASPCAGPILAALLGYVALTRSYAAGFSLLVVYGIGMGLMMGGHLHGMLGRS
nr:cytochrome c biogenesis protein CcdA [bacterium]